MMPVQVGEHFRCQSNYVSNCIPAPAATAPAPSSCTLPFSRSPPTPLPPHIRLQATRARPHPPLDILELLFYPELQSRRPGKSCAEISTTQPAALTGKAKRGHTPRVEPETKESPENQIPGGACPAILGKITRSSSTVRLAWRGPRSCRSPKPPSPHVRASPTRAHPALAQSITPCPFPPPVLYSSCLRRPVQVLGLSTVPGVGVGALGRQVGPASAGGAACVAPLDD
jgi:hypothetical protein